MWYTHNVLIVWLIILIAFVNYSDCAFGPNWYTKKALWIDVSNRINYTLSKFLADFHWQSIGHRFACVWEYIVWSAFKCFRPIEFQMAPKYQIFNTPEETKSNQIVSRAELISMQITCNRCLNLSTKWEWICRAKTKFKTKTRVEYLKLALMHACSKGSINSDVMITLSLFATLSPFGMHFSLSFVYMWWYSISHRWIYTVWCMDSRHLQTGKLYEEIEIIIGSDGFCCSHAHVLHSHSHKLQTMNTKSCQTTWKTRLLPKTHTHIANHLKWYSNSWKVAIECVFWIHWHDGNPCLFGSAQVIQAYEKQMDRRRADKGRERGRTKFIDYSGDNTTKKFELSNMKQSEWDSHAIENDDWMKK